MLAATAVPAAVGLNDGLLKRLFDRACLGFLSYPSGHTPIIFAPAATLTVLPVIAPRPTRATVPCVLVPVVACAIGGAVAVAVIAALALFHRHRGRCRWRHRTGLRARAHPGSASSPAVACRG